MVVLTQVLIVYRSKDCLCVDAFLLLLGTDCECVRHQVIDQTGISMRMTGYGMESSLLYDGFGTSGAL